MAKKMPIDIRKLLESVRTIGAERDLPVAIDIVYDATADNAFIDCIMRAFSAKSDNVHVEEQVLGDAVPQLGAPADLCVIVAGKSKLVGDVAFTARGLGMPAVVVAQEGAGEFREAGRPNATGTALAKTDASAVPASGFASGGAQSSSGKGAGESGRERARATGIPAEDFIEIDLDDKTGRPLEELGVWITNRLVEKRLSMAEDFEFLRHPVAAELAIANSIQNGAIGVVFFMPGADMPVITLNQARMVLEIASVYGQPLDKQRIKELAVVIAGAYGMRGIARQLARQVPGPLGVPLKAAIAFAGTLAMGYAAIDYFEEGGVVAGVVDNANVLYKKADEYAHTGISTASAAADRVRASVTSLANKFGISLDAQAA